MTFISLHYKMICRYLIFVQFQIEILYLDTRLKIDGELLRLDKPVNTNLSVTVWPKDSS